jgi:hypothetical protein
VDNLLKDKIHTIDYMGFGEKNHFKWVLEDSHVTKKLLTWALGHLRKEGQGESAPAILVLEDIAGGQQIKKCSLAA